VHLGARFASDPQGARLQVAYEQGAAMEAGLAAGDVVVAVDGLKASAGNLDTLLAGYQEGERVDVHAFRRDELMRFTVTLAASEADTAYLTLDGDGLSAKGRAWLLGTEKQV
ncbi:MAG TPA: peptidase M61, partial [Alcanivorax sp.]|jgi:predicted metalloprotease with PDZ domain|nr:peptidase M61 [Alcanivorax sp.]